MSPCDAEQFATLLRALLSGDNETRNAAEKSFTDARQEDPNSVLVSVAGCLNSMAVTDVTLRTQAATLLRRCIIGLASEDATWSRASAEVQEQVKSALFQALDSEPNSTVRKLVIATIASIAESAESRIPWPGLVPSTFKLARSQSLAHQETALRLLAELVATPVLTSVLAQRVELEALLGLGFATPALQAASLSLVCDTLAVLDAQQQQALQAVLPAAEEALKALAARQPAEFEEALQSLISVATHSPSFFKPRLAQWLHIMSSMANTEVFEAGQRRLAFEWVSTIAESKPKQVLRAVPTFANLALETGFAFMAQVEEDSRWAEVDEDAGEDDDDMGLHKMGEAKIDLFVDKLGYVQTKEALASLVYKYGLSPEWKGRFSAATAIRASVEYIEDDDAMLDSMAMFLLGLLSDPHMRVRYAALLSLGQMCHDQQPEFHERWHARFVPALISACNDPVDRVTSMAIGSLEAVVGDLEDTVVEGHAAVVLEMVVSKLSSCSHIGILESCMELMGAVAAGLEGQFDQYYDKLMPMLLNFITAPEGWMNSVASSGKLRGKVFEAISLLGYAVGKARFAPAFPLAMSSMLASPFDAADVQKEYVKDAMERMCQIMRSDFAPILPGLLPGIFAAIAPESAVARGEGDGEQAEGEVAVETAKGIFRVKTTQVQDMIGIAKLLSTIVQETGAAFFDYVQPTAEVLGSVLHSSEETSFLISDLRDAIFPCWAALVEIAQKAVPTRGDEARALAVRLVHIFVDKVCADMAKTDEPEDIGSMADGIACVVRNAGAGSLQLEQVKIIADMSIAEIKKSFQREQAVTQGSPPLSKTKDHDEEEDEEGFSEGSEDDEAECRVGLGATLGACMCANPDYFVAHIWPALMPLLKTWLNPQSGIGGVLGLHVAVDLCDHLREKAVPMWPVFMEAVLGAVSAKEADHRNAAAFALNLAAEVPAFGPQYAARAYTVLAMALQVKIKKADEDAKRAQDNTVCALAQLCLRHPEQCPDLDGCWKAILGKLPCKVDLKEGRKTHRSLFEEASKPGGGNLLSMPRVVCILGYLTEIYGHAEHCDEELHADIARAFVRLPEATLAQIKAQLSAKQRRIVERIINDGRSLITTA